MARLFTGGFETQILGVSPYNGEGEFGGTTATITGTPVITTSIVRSGAAALEADQGGTNYMSIQPAGDMVLDRAYFARGYYRFSDASPATAVIPMGVYVGATLVGSLRLETNGTLTLRSGTAPGTQIGSASAALSDNTWYRLELKIIIPTASTGTLEGSIDGTIFATSSSASVGNSITTTTVRFGNSVAGTAAIKTYVDDVALNDNQGANQNSYPGSGKIILLKPTAHSAIGNWVGPQTTGDDVTDLWDNVNNTPPTGVAHADTDANAGKYVFNIVSAAAAHFDVAVQDYTAAGITGSDSITLVQALARMSCNTTTGTNTGAVAGVSNPACTAATAKNLEQGAIAGTETTGWKTWKSAYAYAPSVTLGTSPVVRATKEVANTNAAMVDLMGLVVEYVAVSAYSQTPADNAAGTDALAKTATSPKADTAAGTDAQAKAVTSTKTDTAAGVDAVAKAVTTPRADTGTITDSVTALIIRVQAVSDPAAATDASTRRVTSTKADTAAGTDAIAKRPIPAAKAETASITDAVAKRATTASAEAATVTDAIVTLEGESHSQAVNDAFAGTDSAITLEGEAETLALSDAIIGTDAVATEHVAPILLALAEALVFADGGTDFEMVGVRSGSPDWGSAAELLERATLAPALVRQTQSPIGRRSSSALLPARTTTTISED